MGMLKVWFGNLEDSIYNTSVYFKNTYEPEWLAEDMAKQMIKDIDKSEVISSQCIQSPVFGQITPLQLYGGVKTLLLLMNDPEQVFNASTCGDNCAKWILEIGRQKDVTINLRHIMDFGKEDFEILVLNENLVVHNMKELLPLASRGLADMG